MINSDGNKVVRTAGVLTAVAALLLATGCGGSDAKETSTTSSTTSTVSSTSAVPGPTQQRTVTVTPKTTPKTGTAAPKPTTSPGCYDADGHGPDGADRPCPTTPKGTTITNPAPNPTPDDCTTNPRPGCDGGASNPNPDGP